MWKKICIITIAFVLLTGSALLVADNLRGRDIMKEGKESSLEGILHSSNSEWELKTQEGAFLLHFGNRNFISESGIELKEGQRLSVQGILAGKEFLVCIMTVNGESYRLRGLGMLKEPGVLSEPGGVPFWAGRGNRKEGEDREFTPRNDMPGRKRNCENREDCSFNRRNRPLCEDCPDRPLS